ncbi:MAG: MarR family transcriptional regulator [Pseudomonadota bacterium]
MAGFTLDGFLPYQLAVVSRRVSQDFADRYQQEFDISIPEWRVVAHLSQGGAVSVREIHRRVDMDKSKVSRAATRLEENGFIEKRAHPMDRRLVELTLTDRGQAMIDALASIARAYEAEIMNALGPQAQAFRSALDTLMPTDHLEKTKEDTP